MIDANHLLQLAEELGSPPKRGRPRQTRLRRAVSSAYYATFHSLCERASDLLIGVRERNGKRYISVYRSFEHREIRASCLQSEIYGAEIQECARNFIDLQAARLEADYNPSAYFTTLDVRGLIIKARKAIDALESAGDEERKMFLTSFKFKPRS